METEDIEGPEVGERFGIKPLSSIVGYFIVMREYNSIKNNYLFDTLKTTECMLIDLLWILESRLMHESSHTILLRFSPYL